MAMVLLVCAGLLGKSLYRLLQVDLGLRPEHLVTMQIAAPASDYGKDEQAIALAERPRAPGPGPCPVWSRWASSPTACRSAATATRRGSGCWAGPGTESTTNRRSGT